MSNPTPPCARFESEARVEDGHLVIRLSVATLAHAARHSDYFFQSNNHGTQLLITDEASFAESIRRALNREAEDGSTPITRMLDAATVHVADQGEDGIEVAPTLWAIHIPGPDEFHAAPSKEAAEHMAAMHNKAMQEYITKNKLTWGIEMITALVAAWPYDAESHATALLEFEYAAWGLKGNAP